VKKRVNKEDKVLHFVQYIFKLAVTLWAAAVPHCTGTVHASKDDILGHTGTDDKPEGQKSKGLISISEHLGTSCHGYVLMD